MALTKKILVTGGSGFIGSSIAEMLPQQYPEHYKFMFPTSTELNLTDVDSVERYCGIEGPFHVIIHCASQVTKYGEEQPKDTLKNNLLMFETLFGIADWELFINMGSGAEFDRSKVIETSSDCFPIYPPTDEYGLSKYIIGQRIAATEIDGLINLRLFGVFGPNEKEHRFIKQNILRYSKREHIQIHQDCKFAYFSIYDLIKIIQYCINNLMGYDWSHSLNIGYEDYTTLQEVANIINSLSMYKVPIDIEERGWGKSYYTCDFSDDYEIGEINFLGLERSIHKMFADMKTNGMLDE